MNNSALSTWHKIVQTGNMDLLDSLLDESVVFHSPVVHTPQKGKAITSMYLKAAGIVLFNDSFTYVREVVNDTDAVLEFVTEIDGIQINGVDMISWNEAGKITDFKVLVRPLKAMNMLHTMMGAQLSK